MTKRSPNVFAIEQEKFALESEPSRTANRRNGAGKDRYYDYLIQKVSAAAPYPVLSDPILPWRSVEQNPKYAVSPS